MNEREKTGPELHGEREKSRCTLLHIFVMPLYKIPRILYF